MLILCGMAVMASGQHPTPGFAVLGWLAMTIFTALLSVLLAVVVPTAGQAVVLASAPEHPDAGKKEHAINRGQHRPSRCSMNQRK